MSNMEVYAPKMGTCKVRELIEMSVCYNSDSRLLLLHWYACIHLGRNWCLDRFQGAKQKVRLTLQSKEITCGMI